MLSRACASRLSPLIRRVPTAGNARCSRMDALKVTKRVRMPTTQFRPHPELPTRRRMATRRRPAYHRVVQDESKVAGQSVKAKSAEAAPSHQRAQPPQTEAVDTDNRPEVLKLFFSRKSKQEEQKEQENESAVEEVQFSNHRYGGGRITPGFMIFCTLFGVVFCVLFSRPFADPPAAKQPPRTFREVYDSDPAKVDDVKDESVTVSDASFWKATVQQLETNDTKESLPDVVARLKPTTVMVLVQDVFAMGMGYGAGVIISDTGLVLTARHVLQYAENDVRHVRVVMSDGRELKAHVVGQDTSTDIAVLQLPQDRLYPAADLVVDQKGVRQGELVWTIGAPGGMLQTLSTGTVSCVRRDLSLSNLHTSADTVVDQDIPWMQIDASVGEGNSGGGLFNMKGEVVGVISKAGVSGGSMGMSLGLAVPSFVAHGVVEQLLTSQVVRRASIGAKLTEANTQEMMHFAVSGYDRGALVVNVRPRSAAFRAGLRAGDLIVSMDGEPVPDQRAIVLSLGYSSREVCLTVVKPHDPVRPIEMCLKTAISDW